jgi:hypothetical protein
MQLPGLVAARQLGPIVATGKPICHVSLTIASQGRPVYLDVWESTTPPPRIPGTRQGVLIFAGVGDNRTTEQLVNFSESLSHTGPFGVVREGARGGRSVRVARLAAVPPWYP